MNEKPKPLSSVNLHSRSQGKILVINPEEDFHVIKGLSSHLRISILKLLYQEPRNINTIASILEQPQSTIATNVQILEKSGLITTYSTKGIKGSQKICSPVYQEIIVSFPKANDEKDQDYIEVEMPIGLYTGYEVSPPCGLCSSDNIIGYLDVPATFLEPKRVKAGLLWFQNGYVEYKFPNNGYNKAKPIKRIELVMELSSEKPGTENNWPSDITLWINEIEIGDWTSPGDFGDRRGVFTPSFWKLEGSQYGLLKTWSVTDSGAFIDGVKLSEITLNQLKLEKHHSIRVKLGVKSNAENAGGLNIFGKGFGNYDHDILLRLFY